MPKNSYLPSCIHVLTVQAEATWTMQATQTTRQKGEIATTQKTEIVEVVCHGFQFNKGIKKNVVELKFF